MLGESWREQKDEKRIPSPKFLDHSLASNDRHLASTRMSDLVDEQHSSPSRSPEPEPATAVASSSNSTASSRPAAEPTPSGVLTTEDRTTTTFSDLGLLPALCDACSSLGFKNPSQIQQECIPYALEGKDIIGLAQTGSGKTAAFALPILQALWEEPQGLFAVVLAPTRSVSLSLPLYLGKHMLTATLTCSTVSSHTRLRINSRRSVQASESASRPLSEAWIRWLNKSHSPRNLTLSLRLRVDSKTTSKTRKGSVSRV